MEKVGLAEGIPLPLEPVVEVPPSLGPVVDPDGTPLPLGSVLELGSVELVGGVSEPSPLVPGGLEFVGSGSPDGTSDSFAPGVFCRAFGFSGLTASGRRVPPGEPPEVQLPFASLVCADVQATTTPRLLLLLQAPAHKAKVKTTKADVKGLWPGRVRKCCIGIAAGR